MSVLALKNSNVLFKGVPVADNEDVNETPAVAELIDLENLPLNSDKIPPAFRIVGYEYAHYHFPSRVTRNWKILHGTLYVTGAVIFTAGSYQFFPSVDRPTLGAWLFIIGSVGFVYGDGMEWWHNNRVGCFLDRAYQVSYEKQLNGEYEPRDTWRGYIQRASNGTNYFLSVSASFIYLIGSIAFIPSMNMTFSGTVLFTIGSLAVVVSQFWKLWRIGVDSRRRPNAYCSCIWSKFATHFNSVIMKANTLLGGLAYLIGSIYFFPQIDTNDSITTIAAFWFMLGSAFYVVAAFVVASEYYWSLRIKKRYRRKMTVVIDTPSGLQAAQYL